MLYINAETMETLAETVLLGLPARPLLFTLINICA